MFRIKSTEKELRRFGLILGIVWSLFGIYHLIRGHAGHAVVLIPLGAAFLLPVIIRRPGWLRPVHWLMAAAFRCVMRLTTDVVLTLCFYLVFTPIGLLMRFLGKDLLSRKIERQLESYWSDPERKEFDPDHYTKQF
ncbi:MAG: hypothetical protein ACLFPX_01660 [Candidatus Omnitrophota bacterium]